MPELTTASELIRVTQVPFRRSRATIIRGVPVREGQSIASAKYSVSVIASSECLPVDPVPGQIWRVEGHKRTYSHDYGRIKKQEHQYREPDNLEFLLPHTGETFVQFISDDKAFRGVGARKAHQLWARFGEDIHRMLTAGTPNDLDALSGLLSTHSIQALRAGYEKYANLRHTAWMSKARIPRAVQKRVLKHQSLGAVEAIKSDPYKLIYFGLSFKDIDNILKHRFGHAWERDRYPQERIQAGVVQALKDRMKDGSTWVKASQLKTRASDYLKSPAHHKKGIEWLKGSPAIAVYHEGGRFHDAVAATQELVVATRIKHLIDLRRPLTQVEVETVNGVIGELPYDLTNQQELAVSKILSSGISAITGGAGTGKTTVLSTVLKAADRMGYNIRAIALSDRAAMRLQESVGCTAMTIARFLLEDPVTDDRALLAIDDASTTDLPTMFRIINHINPACKLVLVGDLGQLPPIGMGKILHDLVLSIHVPNTMLDIVKCQQGAAEIPEYSKAVSAGEIPEPLSVGNIYFHEVLDLRQAKNKAVELYVEKPHDSRVIAPTVVLVDEVNREIQERMNSESPLLNFNLNSEDFPLRFRLNDQVLFTENHPGAGVQDGSLGELVSVGQVDDVIGTVALDTGEKVDLQGGLIDALSLGYAMTLQDVQGSQFKRVIVLIQDTKLLDRSWIYTAITRAASEVHIIGDPLVFGRFVKAAPKAFRRKTMLTNLIDHLHREKV